MRCPECKQEVVVAQYYTHLLCMNCFAKFRYDPTKIEKLWFSLAIIAALQELSNQVNKRYWTSWWTSVEDGTPGIPFQYWVTGYRDNLMAVCALLEGPNRWYIEQGVKKLFPDAEFRFIEPRDHDWNPGERFPGYEERVKI